MASVVLDPSLTMHYEDDCFADPWQEAEAVLMIHGVAESSLSWYGWVPHLGREFRVLRPDLRGFGRSTVPPEGYVWSPEGLASDLARFLNAVDVGPVHVVGAKFGGTIALQFAADYPGSTRSLAVASGPVRARRTGGRADLTVVADLIRQVGVLGWASQSQRTRLGTEVSDAQIAWWNRLMASTDPRVCLEVTAAVADVDVSESLPRIQAPTLVITTENSGLASLETVRGWQQQIPDSELLVMPGDSYHVAAARPDECAQHVLSFIERHTAR